MNKHSTLLKLAAIAVLALSVSATSASARGASDHYKCNTVTGICVSTTATKADSAPVLQTGGWAQSN